MGLTRSDTILRRQLTRRGLAAAVVGSRICQEAERLYPGIFAAVSVRSGVLHLAVTRAHLIDLKMIEGTLLSDLNRYCTAQQLPLVRRIRLTIQE